MQFHVRTDTGILYATIDNELFNALDYKGYLKPTVKDFVGKGKTTVWVFTEDCQYEIPRYGIEIQFWKGGYVKAI